MTSILEVSGAIRNAKSILISTHLLPDGDGLGAQFALYHYLKKAGKKCQIISPDPIPRRYRFLDQGRSFSKPSHSSARQKTYDLWIILDTHDPKRLGELWKKAPTLAKRIIFLDHHPRPQGKLSLSYPSNTTVVSETNASSIGELLYELFKNLNLAALDPQIALGIYVSIMTDTNSFRYSRTTSAAHQIAGEMISFGLDPEQIYQKIYSSKTVSHLQLLGVLLQNTKISESRKIAWIEMNRSLRLQYRATADETLSFLNLLLLIQDAEVICFFREEDDGTTRVSIKSKGRLVVSQLAMELGGGGHDYAAGLALPASLDQTRSLVISRLETLAKRQLRKS